jgi:hypothetical protein
LIGAAELTGGDQVVVHYYGDDRPGFLLRR